MKIGFWNLGRSGLAAAMLPQFAEEQSLDLLALAEFPSEADGPAWPAGTSHWARIDVGGSRLRLYSRYSSSDFTHLVEAAHSLVVRVGAKGSAGFNLCVVHLSSKRFRSGPSTDQNAALEARLLQDFEARVGSDRTVVIGDFNLHPHDAGMVGVAGFHAVMDRQRAKSGNRIVNGRSHRYFFNPMWGLYGDAIERPAGTYHYDSSEEAHQFWTLYDQVLVSPSLLESLPRDCVRITAAIGGISLTCDRHRPNRKVASDHLPLVF